MSSFLSARGDGVTISLDTTLCKGCGICASVCPTEVFDMRGGGRDRLPEPVAVEACIECGKCELICPDFALEVSRDE